MKKILLALLGITLLSGCNKEQAQYDNTITYTVKCKSCLFVYQDEVWNNNKTQYVNVYGKHTIEFTHKKLKSAKLKLYKSYVSCSAEVVTLIVTKNGKVIHNSQDELCGLDIDGKGEVNYEVVF